MVFIVDNIKYYSKFKLFYVTILTMYSYETTVKLHQTDGAGRLFFSEQFTMVHDAYQQLLESLGIGFSVIFKKKNYFCPIVHAQADYKKPLFVDDRLTIELTVSHIGESSFSFAYRLLNEKNSLVGTAKTVHVAVSKKSGKKITLPPEIRKALAKV